MATKSSNTYLFFVALMTIAISVFSCDDPRIYDHYEAIPQEGWERSDMLTFHIPAIQQSGTYQQAIGLRATQDYPFQSLTLIVEQTIFPKKQTLRDTITCCIINEQGRMEGKNGISSTEVVAPLRTLQLKQGDSLAISIRHDMQRVVLPGITDVGIRITSPIKE